MKTLASLLAGVFTCLVLVASCAEDESTPLDADEYARELTQATNDAREELGLDPLTPSDCLAAEARERATVLVGQELEHLPLNGVSEVCGGTRAAENLVETTLEPTAAVSEWMQSSGHRNNIIDPSLTEVGTGCAKAKAHMLCSQLFLAIRG